jgi:hypothetical protein
MEMSYWKGLGIFAALYAFVGMSAFFIQFFVGVPIMVSLLIYLVVIGITGCMMYLEKNKVQEDKDGE